MAHARPPTQAGGIAQPLAESGEIPGAAVVPAVVVAACATHVAVAGQPRVAGVVEQLLAQKHGGRELLGGHRAHRRQQRRLGGAPRQQRPQVVGPHGTVHEVADEQLVAVRRQRQALRRPTGVEAEQLPVVVGVDHRDLAAGLERDEQVDAAPVVDRSARQARVVVVDARLAVLQPDRHVDLRADRANGVLEVEGLAVACRAALDVVLLGRHPGLQPVGRDRRGAEVVRHAAARALAVGNRAGVQHDRLPDVEPTHVDEHDLAAGAARGDPGRALARQRRRDEARHQHLAAFRVDRQVAHVAADVQRAGAREGLRVEAQHLPQSAERHVGPPVVGREHDAVGQRATRQRNGARHRHRARVDHADRRRLAVDHPDAAVGGNGQGARGRAHGDLPEPLARRRIEYRHRVVVRVHDPDLRIAGRRLAGGDARGHRRALARGRQVDRVHDRLADLATAVVGRRHAHVVHAGRGEALGDRRVRRPGRGIGAVTEIPAIAGVDAIDGPGGEGHGGVDHAGPGRHRRLQRQRWRATPGRGHRPDEAGGRRVHAVARRRHHVVAARHRRRAADQAGRAVDGHARRQAAGAVAQRVAVRIGRRQLQRHGRTGCGRAVARVRQHGHGRRVGIGRDAHLDHARDRRHACRVDDEQHVEPRRCVAGPRGRLDRQLVALYAESQFDETLVHVPAVRRRTGADHRHSRDRPAAAPVGEESLADRHRGGRPAQGRARRAQAVGVEQVGRRVDLRIRVVLGTGCAAAGHEHRGVGQQECRRVVEPRAIAARAARPAPRGGVPDLGAVVHAGQRVPGRAAARGQHLTIRQDGRVGEATLRGHRLGRREGGRGPVDVDDHCAVRRTAELQNAARAEHRGAGVAAAVRRRKQAAEASHRAGARRVHVVDLAIAVVAEDPAVRRDEVARVHEVQPARVGGRQQPELAVGATDLGTVGAARAALDVDLAVQQRGRRRIPARAVHVVAAVERVVAEPEDVGVVVAGVGGAGAVPVVTAREEYAAALGQHELGAAENVGQRHVRQGQVRARAGAERGIPDVVDEPPRLLAVAVRAVGEHPAVGHQRRVHGDQRPGVHARPGPAHVVRQGRRGVEREAHGGNGRRRADDDASKRDPPMAVASWSGHQASPEASLLCVGG